MVLNLARQQRAAALELAEHVPAVRPVLLQERDQPPVERPVGPPHPRPQQRQILDRPEERIPFDEQPLLPEQPVELGRVVTIAEAAPEHEVLRRGDDGDRVELQEPEVPHGGEHVGRASVEQLRAHGDAPRLLDADLTQALRAPVRWCARGDVLRVPTCRGACHARGAPV